MMNVFEYLTITPKKKGFEYVVIKSVAYYSERYDKHIIADIGFESDGATGALDINTFGWLLHDVLCEQGTFSDGTPCNNWQASMILSDILHDEGRWFRSKTWFWATWLIGGGKARNNGMW